MERWVKNDTENYIYYYYDESGVCGMCYNGSEYYYRKNIFGDVIEIYNNLGALQCKYVYDAWGNHKVYGASGVELSTSGTNIGNINPIRYRSYYWDSEFSLYYLQSRYYDPALGRFISADSVDYLDPEDVAGLNLYSYCNNNPVMSTDPGGHFVISTLLIGALIGAVASFGASVLSQSLTGDKKINWGQVALDTVIGGISGALGASGINQVTSIIAGGVLGVAGSVGGDLIASNGDWSEVNVWKAIVMGGVGALIGSWTGAGTQNTKAMVKSINAGKSWGSKAFLKSTKEVALRPNSGLTLQTMYMNMAKAISKYTFQGISKVSVAAFVSAFLGNLMG